VSRDRDPKKPGEPASTDRVENAQSDPRSADLNLGISRFVALAQENLSPKELEQLKERIGRIGVGRRYEQLYVEMAQAVQENIEKGLHKPQKLREFFQILAKYDGPMHILERFLNTVSPLGGKLERDPFKATVEAQFGFVYDPKKVPQELQERLEELRETPRSAKQRRSPIARGGSGQFQAGSIVWIKGPEAIESGIDLFGVQSFTTIYDGFKPGQIQRLKPKAHAQQTASLLEALSDALPSEAVASGKLLADPNTKSWIAEDKSSLIQELNKIIAQAKAAADQALYGRLFLASDFDTFRVRSDNAGNFWNWHRKRIEDPSCDVSEAIKSAYYACSDPNVWAELPQHERVLFMTALQSEFLLNSFVDKERFLSDLERDFNWYSELGEAEKEALQSRYGNPHSALTAVREKISRGSSELSYMDLKEVLNIRPLREMRKGENLAYIEQDKKELEAALNRFRALFFEAGHLRADCRAESLPMRLKTSFPGLTLTREDWLYVKRASSLWHVAGEDLHKVALAQSIPEFHEMIDHVLLAHRKVRHLEDQFTKKGISLPFARGEEGLNFRELVQNPATPIPMQNGIPIEAAKPGYQSALADPETLALQKALESWQPKLLRSSKYILAHRLSQGIDLAEASKRFLDRTQGKAAQAFERLIELGQFGIMHLDDHAQAKELILRMAAYAPIADLGLQQEFERARAVMASNRLSPTSPDLVSAVARNYLLEAEVPALKKLLAAVDEVGELLEKAHQHYSDSAFEELSDRLHALGGPEAPGKKWNYFRHRDFWVGGLREAGEGKREFVVLKKRFSEVMHDNGIAIDQGNAVLRFRDPAQMLRAEELIRANFVHLDAGDEEKSRLLRLLGKARFLTSFAAQSGLRELGVKDIPPHVWSIFSDKSRNRIDLTRDMVSTELLAAIESLNREYDARRSS